MHLTDTFQSALKGITVNVNRSLLTMLGIIIGVGSVVLMSAIGSSMQGVILGQISSLGAKSMVIFPGSSEGGPSALGAGRDSLTFEDIRELEQLGTITTVAPIIYGAGPATYGKEESSAQIFGVTAAFFDNQNLPAIEGRLIDTSDVNGNRYVALVAPEARDKLFGQEDPIGKSIKVGSNHYTVIGVTKALGSQFFQSADNRIYIPYSVARQVTGQKYVNYVTMTATESFAVAIDDVKFLLRRRHGIKNPADDPKKDDFIVHSSEEAGQILGSVSLGLTLFITTIAAISLIVGGIGIMNIMLVSVTERTREIGLRKALGATHRDILLQFLTESVMLTVIGGLIGMVGGVALAVITASIVKNILATYVFAISLPSMIIAFLMAVITGLVFGITPAKRAAELSPMEALRYE
ncbi:MAG: putative transport system permease protein [Candidatus Peribacteria bacterium]|nr:putative transport system permease protein [Candidatus Peribacteria bacterium]